MRQVSPFALGYPIVGTIGTVRYLSWIRLHISRCEFYQPRRLLSAVNLFPILSLVCAINYLPFNTRNVTNGIAFMPIMVKTTEYSLWCWQLLVALLSGLEICDFGGHQLDYEYAIHSQVRSRFTTHNRTHIRCKRIASPPNKGTHHHREWECKRTRVRVQFINSCLAS